MITTMLLFTRFAEPLGEIHLKDGAFVQAAFTARGEQVFGTVLNDWQVHGIPVFRHPASHVATHTDSDGFTLHRVQPRDAGFGDALQEWCSQHTITVVVLSSRLHLECWQKLLRMPILAADRLAMLVVIARASADDLIAWQQFLSDPSFVPRNAPHAIARQSS
ncbi:MAG: hypothetical protein RL141_261 [Candidatus Parcubacteria bacterium]|jgi:hypothetical protein